MKIALIYAFKESSWFSCTKITNNLLQSYKMAFSVKELAFFDYDFENKNFDLVELANDIYAYGADKIVFLDHQPHPVQLLEILVKRKYLKDTLPEIIIHIFGCFTLNFQLWKRLGVLLKESKVKFFCASDRQVQLVEQFFEDKKSFIRKVPFPVSSTEFFYKEENNKIKDKLGLKDSDKFVLYTGRLSLQKRIIELVEVFVKAHQNNAIDNNTYLVLAGKFDSLAFKFGDVYHHEGEYFRLFDRAISKHPKEILNKVILLGNVKNSELQQYYSAADLFVSFSTYHDEDYGMSVAEAGSCGCPLLLTDWAGFSSFQKNDSCQLVKTYLTKEQPEFDLDEAYKKFITMLKSEKLNLRKETSEIFYEQHSVESIAKTLQKIILNENNDFRGFNSFIDELAYAESKYPHLFYSQLDRELNKNYFKVYKAYVREN